MRATANLEAAMVIEELRRCLETGDWERLREVYAPDAVLDANVPQWRFQRKGVDDIVAQHRHWHPAPGRIVEWTSTPTGKGAVVEEAIRREAGGDQDYCRTVHLLHVDGGRIVRHVLYCTGWWDRPTVERHRLEAPMFEEEAVRGTQGEA